MVQYESVRENGWRLLYKNDPAFEYNDIPVAKVISFFLKRRSNEAEVDLTKQTKILVDFEIKFDVSWLHHHLDHTIKYKRKWNDYNLALLGNLQHYLNQCVDGGYKKCILSKQEYMQIKAK